MTETPEPGRLVAEEARMLELRWTDLTEGEQNALEVIALGRASGLAPKLERRLVELKLATREGGSVNLTQTGLAVSKSSVSRRKRGAS